MTAAEDDTDQRDQEGQAQPGRPPVNVTNSLNAVDWLLGEIGDPRTPLAGLFNRGGQLVHIHAIGGDGYHDEPDDGGPTIEPVDCHKLAALVTTKYSPYRMGNNGQTGGTNRTGAVYYRDEARAVCNSIRDAIELRHLRGVIHTPLPRADGTLITRPGYDEDSELVYLPDPGLDVGDIPAEPTAEEIAEATALLRHMVTNFPWAGDHDLANFLGVLLTPLLRLLCPGPYKAAIIGARQPGSGKSLLGKILRAVHGGTMQAEFPDTEKEVGNVILGVLTQTTGSVIEFDNVTGILRSPKLASLLTSPTYSGRMLQTTNSMTVPNDRMWVFTGNNLQLGGDLARRTTWITIDPNMENPERRTEFAIPDLTRWVAQHRGDILHALLTLIAAWVAAGKPTARTDSDTYSPWITTIRGILGVAGVPGVFDHEDSIEQTIGSDDDEWGVMLHGIHNKIGPTTWTAKSLLAMMQDPSDVVSPFARQPLTLDILPDELRLKLKTGQPNSVLSKSLGRWLMNRKGRWSSGYVVRAAGKDRARTSLWSVERRDAQTEAPFAESEFEGDAGPVEENVKAVETLAEQGLFPPERAPR